MSQSQETQHEIDIAELPADDDAVIETTPPPSAAASEVANQGASTPVSTATAAASSNAAVAKPQKPKKRTYTKRGGASASDAKTAEDSDEDEVRNSLHCCEFLPCMLRCRLRVMLLLIFYMSSVLY